MEVVVTHIKQASSEKPAIIERKNMDKLNHASPEKKGITPHSIKISWSPAMYLDAPLWLLYQVPSSHWLHKTKYRFLRGRDFFVLSPSSNSLMVHPTVSPDLPVGRYFLNQIRSTITSTPTFPFH
ncbi:hypothetical protein BCR42DRAFT_398730 [Absidia repens]|uniref:Uncharacterized protein n=1 Tax=Absidia repens TaxID=90262 RepID=A0A1X2HX27_9FUNG|nr:hypothetical protein BCR42DRAFT_398730 [Absidia repens]